MGDECASAEARGNDLAFLSPKCGRHPRLHTRHRSRVARTVRGPRLPEDTDLYFGGCPGVVCRASRSHRAGGGPEGDLAKDSGGTLGQSPAQGV